MKYRIGFLFSLVLTMLFFVSCNNGGKSKSNSATAIREVTTPPKAFVKAQYISLTDSIRSTLKKRANEIIFSTKRILVTRLQKYVKKDGAEAAVGFCKKEAMKITDSLSQSFGVTIRRLAKKYRNPENETHGTETRLYKQYILNWLAGQPLKAVILPDSLGHPVFYSPIKVKHFCLICHGEPGKTMNAGLAEKIKKYYPNDKATGFKVGELRGMWAITFPQYILKLK